MQRLLAIALMVGICINVQGISWYCPKIAVHGLSKGINLLKNHTVNYTKSIKLGLRKSVQSTLAFVRQNPKKTGLLGMSAAAVATACWLGMKKLIGIWVQAGKVPKLEKDLQSALELNSRHKDRFTQEISRLNASLVSVKASNQLWQTKIDDLSSELKNASERLALVLRLEKLIPEKKMH